MQATDLGNRDDLAEFRPLNSSAVGRILVKREVSTRPVVVREVASQGTAQVSFAKDEDVIQTFAPDGADKALRERVLPWAVRRRQNFTDAHAVPRQNLIRLGQERRDPSIRPQAKTPSLGGGRATGIVRPSALHGHTGVAMEDGEQVGWAAELDLGRVFDGSEDSRCWTTPPGGGSGHAGHRLR